MDELKATYNKIAEDWHRDHKSDTWWIETTDKFISLLKPGDLVLDVGCGGGLKAKYLISKGLKVTGIDFAENMIAIARREVPAGTFFVMDLRDLPRMDGTFDGILVHTTLVHIPKREVGRAVQIFKEKLKPGGYLYITVKEIRSGQDGEEVKAESDYGYPYERFWSYFNLPEVETYLREAGFYVCYSSITPLGNSRWLQVTGQKRAD